MQNKKLEFSATKKQLKCIKSLHDKKTKEIIFGGGAGGGKSLLGCVWLLLSCLKHPGSKWLMGRSELKTLRETTLATFFDFCSKWEMQGYLTFNAQHNVIHFINGSQIILKDLFAYPSDPNFDALGSLEITGAFIDECNQISHKCFEVVKSRIRYKLDEFKLIPKILGTCNPSKNWVYSEFYKPWKDGELIDSKCFIQALAVDNPFISKHYIENLKSIKDSGIRERLLYGNWEYDDDPARLFTYENILNLFSNSIEPGNKHYITCDVARKGKDKTVIMVWRGLEVVEIKSYDVTLITDTVNYIQQLKEKYKVPLSHIIADEDGLGGGVVDVLKCKGFVSNSQAIQNSRDASKPNYRNLKAQAYFKLANLVENNEIRINCDNVSMKERIVAELEQIKIKNIDKDQKNDVISKDDLKAALGYSPDFADALMIRMYYELRVTPNTLALWV